MFDLNEAIRTWRKRMQATGNIEDGEAEELESHLRDAIENFCTQGLGDEAAFEKATRQIGPVGVLANEHGFSHERKAWQVSRTFLPGLFINYLKVAVRGMRSNESYNWINIAGLAIGLTSCLFITYFTLFELSYDRQYADTHIYRIINEGRTAGGVLEKDAGGPVPLGPTLLDEYPEIKQSVRLWRAYLPTITYEDKIFQERKFLFADSNLLNVFPFDLAKGQAVNALKLANSIILSEGTAEKYFGDQDPIGRTITYNGFPGDSRSFLVTGVFRNLPVNTHFDFDFVASFQSIQDVEAGWGSFKPVWTYLELASAAAAVDLEQKLPAFAEKYLPNRKKDRDLRFRLEPVASIYLHSDSRRPMKPGGNIALLRILGFTGILILLMSCANFIHIALGRVLVRLREAGVRKVLGATRSQLLTQNLSEVLLSLLISLLAATTLIYLLIPSFESVTQIPFTFSFMVRPQFILTIITLLLLIVILTGYLPASFVWGLSVVQSLRQRISPRNGNAFNGRRALLGFQFMTSGALIMSLLVVNDQLNFIRKLDVGATLDNIVAIPFSENPDVFENRVRALGVGSMAYSQRLPVNTLNYDGRIVRVAGLPDPLQVESCFITSEFLDTYRIELLEGRNLNSNSLADSNKFLLNETAMKALGWNRENVIGQGLEWSGYMKGEVVGVVKDFQLESVHSRVPPMIMLNALEKDAFQRNFISIKLEGANQKETREGIRKIWREMNPGGAYYEVSMPESYEQLHRSDLLFGKVIFWFTSIALFISIIGLYATASFAAERKKKDIGVRKVLGSSVQAIFIRLLRPFFGTAIITVILITPFVIYLMNRWLDTFAYHTVIRPTTLLTGVLVVLAMTVISTLKVTLGAALLNPVRFLRDE